MATNCDSCGHRTNEVSWKTTDPFLGGGGEGEWCSALSWVGVSWSPWPLGFAVRLSGKPGWEESWILGQHREVRCARCSRAALLASGWGPDQPGAVRRLACAARSGWLCLAFLNTRRERIWSRGASFGADQPPAHLLKSSGLRHCPQFGVASELPG